MSVLVMTKVRQYLTFSLADGLFAADVSRVREILELVPVTRVPGTSDAVRGVINVRGSVVPVVDMRRKFELPEKEDDIETCIVVVEVKIDEKPVVLGAIVDSVEEVLELSPDDVEPAPKIGTMVDASFIEGLGKHDAKFVIILDVDRVFNEAELNEARATGEDSPS